MLALKEMPVMTWHRFLRRIDSRLYKGILSAAVVAVLIAATSCESTPRVANDRDGSVTKTETAESEREEILKSYPAIIEGKFGTSRTLAYDQIDQPRLSDKPYDKGRVRMFGESTGSFLGLRSAVELAQRARLVVQGTVVQIGRPHFASDDGSFWHPALHNEPGVVDVDNAIFRDVAFRVDDVWGNALTATWRPELARLKPGDTFAFLSPGGQVKVSLAEETANKLEYPGGGTYIFAEEVPTDLATGEKALLFLDSARVSGLYNGKYGYHFELFPAHELYYKYSLRDGQAVNTFTSDLTMPTQSLRVIVEENIGEAAGPTPAQGTFPATPHPVVTETGAPPREEDGSPHNHPEPER